MVKEKLFEARTKKGLSQEQLADLVGMTQSNYSRKENGVKKIVDAEWDKIAKELEVKKEDIYEEDNVRIVYKGDKGSVNNSGTIHYFNMPDFVLEHIELLKSQNASLKIENQKLKEEIDKKK
ncbi:MAG TPA: transcriptional regulator [Flavobacterium sp.]|nr:transcriptional regulator [Flavobacterium sp.]HAT80885.1 transcriptional regulator [Flavobacterium sp.]